MTIAPLATPLLGGCLCGRVRYRVSDHPIAYYACHCSDCRRESGAAYGLIMIFRRSAFEQLAGTVRDISVTVPGGIVRNATLCDTCFVRVWNVPSRYPQVIMVSPGTLDDGRAYVPFGNLWLASACPWVEPMPGPRFDREPGDPTFMVRAWQEHRREK